MRNAAPNRFLIAGKANAGKTLFLLNFAEYMGYDNLSIKFKTLNEESTKKNTLQCFRKDMVNDLTNTTKCLQIINMDIPVLKGHKTAEFIDSTGVSSSIHFEQDVRDGMVQTLSLLRETYIIIHMIDAASVFQEKKIDDIDFELYKYGNRRGNYILLANKMDLKDFDKGLEMITSSFTDIRIFKVSALNKTGFNEIKRYVAKIV
jgi:tRNA U34 5-carboxymethylaminomethyl modifying GTPase MnmE/TrmE